MPIKNRREGRTTSMGSEVSDKANVDLEKPVGTSRKTKRTDYNRLIVANAFLVAEAKEEKGNDS